MPHLDELDGNAPRFPSVIPPVDIDGLPAGAPVAGRWVMPLSFGHLGGEWCPLHIDLMSSQERGAPGRGT